MKKVIIILSFICNFFFIFATAAFIHSKGGYRWVVDKTLNVFSQQLKAGYPQYKIDIFKQLPPIGTGDIVFLGDSLFDYGEWHEWLGEHAKNRAINGDDTADILYRLHEVTKGKPRHIILCIGLNNFEKNIPLDKTKSDYTDIIKIIRKESSDSDIWLLPLIPVNRSLYQRYIIPGNPGIIMPKPEDIQSLNTFIKKMVNKKVHYIELPELLSSTSELSSSYTFDGEHFNGAGLKLIAKKIQKSIRK